MCWFMGVHLYSSPLLLSFVRSDMTARKSILVVSSAPGATIMNVAQELASRGHFTIFACKSVRRNFKEPSSPISIQTVELDLQSRASLSLASTNITSILNQNGFYGLDVLVNDIGVGSSLALLDVMMDESPDQYEEKVADSLSLASAFADLLSSTSGKIVNMSSSGAMISALCMSRSQDFVAPFP